MSARLPNVGGDDGDWGAILNTFLQVSHDSTGNLLASAVAQAGAVTTGQVGSANGVAGLNGSSLVPSTQLGAGTASSSNFLRGDGTWAVPAGGGAVTSVFTRSGAVTAQAGDYTAAQVTNAADKSSASAQTFAGNVSAPAVVAAGLTGATAASRYAGATASGAPASGTFNVGDFVADQTGAFWVCTTAGSPGTWKRANLVLDGTASDIQALGAQAAGSTGKAADAGHIHPTTGLVVQSGSTMNGYLAPKVVVLTFAASLTIDVSQGNAFELTLTGNVTSLTISNAVAGELIRILLIQDATGSRTVTWPASFDWGSAGAPTLSTTANKTDMIVAHYSSSLGKWLASSALGF